MEEEEEEVEAKSSSRCHSTSSSGLQGSSSRGGRCFGGDYALWQHLGVPSTSAPTAAALLPRWNGCYAWLRSNCPTLIHLRHRGNGCSARNSCRGWFCNILFRICLALFLLETWILCQTLPHLSLFDNVVEIIWLGD